MYDVFISCKSEDYGKAEPIYRWLVSVGYNPFFAPVSLNIPANQDPSSYFGEEIDNALDEAKSMIVFSSKAEYINKKGYVKTEWRTFVEEQRAGRKEGSLVTILEDIPVEDLPIALRPMQSFTPQNFKEGIRRYLGKVSANEPQDNPSFNETVDELMVLVKGEKFKMVKVEGGTFMMGATEEQEGSAFDDEKPVHMVTLSDYYIGETVVTQGLWNLVMGNKLLHIKNNDNLPMVPVSWSNAQEFIKKLNKETRKHFRLPTEAEWEFAARGGVKSKGYKFSGSNNIDEVAWYNGNSGQKPHPVKGKKSNELGLYDMCGNVWEWCSDWYGDYSSGAWKDPEGPSAGKKRVYRGGSCFSFARGCRVSYRNHQNTFKVINLCGLRLVLCP